MAEPASATAKSCLDAIQPRLLDSIARTLSFTWRIIQ